MSKPNGMVRDFWYPTLGWHMENFIKLADLWGDFIGMAEHIENKTSFDSGKILVDSLTPNI